MENRLSADRSVNTRCNLIKTLPFLIRLADRIAVGCKWTGSSFTSDYLVEENRLCLLCISGADTDKPSTCSMGIGGQIPHRAGRLQQSLLRVKGA